MRRMARLAVIQHYDETASSDRAEYRYFSARVRVRSINKLVYAKGESECACARGDLRERSSKGRGDLLPNSSPVVYTREATEPPPRTPSPPIRVLLLFLTTADTTT